MHFDIKKNGKATILKVHDKKLDAAVSPDLKGEFLVLCTAQLKELIVDLSAVDFCDSSGLGALLIAERKMREHGGIVKLVGVQKKILTLIKISHLDRTFQLYDSLADAIKK
ncbi:MAG: STAS domain-containing protein [Bacteroidota bacterium]